MKKNTYKKFRENYLNFYNGCYSLFGAKGLTDLKQEIDLEAIIRNYDAIGPFVYYICDYTTHKFIQVGGSCEQLFGYKSSDFEGKGFSFCYKITPVLDIIRLLRGGRVFWNQFKETPLEDRPFLRVNFTTTFKRKDGTTFEGFQQNRPILFDEKGNAIYFLVIITDISDFKTQFSTHEHYILNVKDPTNVIKTQIKFKDTEKNKPVSPAEIRVLKLLAEGLKTKEIAAQLYLSEHTVNVHRKNLLQKLECSSSSQLIKKALMAGIL
jgi:DNA-binding CsgD family transcriptional regulator